MKKWPRCWPPAPTPLTAPNYGHGMLFRTFEGQELLVLHSHQGSNGHYHRVPRLFETGLSGDKLVIIKPYRP